MTDITQIKPTTREVPLLHPGTMEEMGLVFILRSPHHPEVRAVEREWQNAQLRRRNLDITVEQFEASRVKTLTAHVEGWYWVEGSTNTIGGEQPDFTRAACSKLIRESAWVKDFLDGETNKTARFYEGSVPA